MMTQKMMNCQDTSKSFLCVCRTVKFKTNFRNFATVQKSMACTKSHLTKGMPPSTFTALHATHCRWMWLGHWEDGAFLWILAVKGSNLAWEDVTAWAVPSAVRSYSFVGFASLLTLFWVLDNQSKFVIGLHCPWFARGGSYSRLQFPSLPLETCSNMNYWMLLIVWSLFC